MPRLGRIIVGVVATIAVVILTTLTAFIPPPYGPFLAVGAGLLAFAIFDKVKDYVSGKSDGNIALNVEPLPHYKGILTHPLVSSVIDEATQNTVPEMESGLKATTPEFERLAKSQWIMGFQNDWPKDIGTHDAYLKGIKWETFPWRELVVKFGVLRVHCTSGDAIGVRAEVKEKIIEQWGWPFQGGNWHDLGYLNWFSPALKLAFGKIPFDEVEANKVHGINKYLINSREDIHQGEYKDLLMFYMVKGVDHAFVCTEGEIASAGMVALGTKGSKTLKFELEVKLTATGYRTTQWHYLVTIPDFDEFQIQRI